MFAGSVIASRLSEIESWNVLLIEAGPDESLLSGLIIIIQLCAKEKLKKKLQKNVLNFL